jgi:hypothetical protein
MDQGISESIHALVYAAPRVDIPVKNNLIGIECCKRSVCIKVW